MKRISFITLCLVALALTAKAQIIPHYGETCEKGSGKLRGKAWISAVGFRQETPNENGKTNIIIYRVDSAKVFILNTDKKTWMAFSLSQLTSGKLSGVAAFERESHNVKRTFINEEEAEGKMCNHYRVETATALKGGTTDRADWEEWIYEPDRIWRQRTDDVKAGGYLVHRNIKTGEQPAHLFEIPKDFKGSYLPAGGMLEMFTGKAQDGGNTGAATFQNLVGTEESEEKAKSANDLMKELKEAEKIQDTQKRQQEMARIMKEMNNLKKKKK
jgi:hypothetical protein